MGLKVYIAGGSSERYQVADMIRRVRGFAEVTHDWTEDPGFGRGCGTLAIEHARYCGETSHGGIPTLCPTCLDPRRIAETDRAAVDAADVVWCMLPAEKSEGMSWEFGYAVGRGKVVVFSGHPREYVFRTTSSRFFDSISGGAAVAHERALDYIREMAANWDRVDTERPEPCTGTIVHDEFTRCPKHDR